MKQGLRYRFFNKLAIKQGWTEENRQEFTLSEQYMLIADTIDDILTKIAHWLEKKLTIKEIN